MHAGNSFQVVYSFCVFCVSVLQQQDRFSCVNVRSGTSGGVGGRKSVLIMHNGTINYFLFSRILVIVSCYAASV